MKNTKNTLWNWLTGDTNFTDYGGSWYRRIPGTTRYHVIRLDNWEELCGGDAPDATYNVTLSEVEWDTSFVPEDDEDPGDLERVATLHEEGSKAPLGEWNGNNYQKLIQEAKRRSRELDDPRTYKEAMERPVNKIGSTAKEFQQGDVLSAVLRGVAGGDPTAELMLKLGVGST